MPFTMPKLPWSGTGDMNTDVKNAVELVQKWKAAAAGNLKGESYQGVVPDGKFMVPAEIIANTHGICFLFYVKVGFVFTGELGTGFVIRRLNRGEANERWSAPTAITSGGMGWGAQVGAEKIYTAVFLQSQAAVDVFGDKAKVNFGADAAIAAGPVGRNFDIKGEAGTGGVAVNYSYSYAAGAFAGIALNGAVMGSNPMMNETFYGQKYNAHELVHGAAGLDHQTPLLDELYRELEELFDIAKRVVNEQHSGTDKEGLVQ